MATLREILRELTPPAVMKAYQRWWVREEVPFHGHYSDFGEVPDEDPWAGPYWQTLSREKLDRTIAASRVRAERGDGRLVELVPDYYGYLSLVVNQLSRERPCSVLDFGGGTGFVYHHVKPGLTHLDNVSWHVIDGPSVTAMGESARAPDDPLRFDSDLSAVSAADVVYLNTVLQYIPDYEALLRRLLSLEPDYVVMTRLLAGPMPTYVVMQVIGGLKTPCRFVNFDALTELFAEHGYGLELVSQGDPLDGYFARDVPEELRIPYDLTAIFAKRHAADSG